MTPHPCEGRSPRPRRLATAALCLALLGGLAALLETGLVTPVDLAVNAALAPWRLPWLLVVFAWITALGTGAALVGVALTATAFLWSGGRAGLVVPLWTAFLGAEATTWTVKFLVERPRPAVLPGVTAALSPSFPSAHATAATAVIGFTSYVVTRSLPRRQDRAGVGLLAAALVALIVWSRLYLGLHYLTDVLAGCLSGGAWLLIGIASARSVTPQQRTSSVVQPVSEERP